MLSVYIVCLLAGGIVLGASMFGGHDSRAGVDAHAELDAHAGHELHAHHEWVEKLPILSLRFWTWSATFFGLTGLTLSLTGTSSGAALALAILAGVGTGWGASFAISRLTKSAVGVLPEASSHIGCEGRLLLPLVRGERSKVRLRVGGMDVDLVAESDSQETMPAGTSVWVVELRGTHAVVEASPLPPDRLATTETDKEKP
jgi:membrane protein implicated in regulation of membrane protease activity